MTRKDFDLIARYLAAMNPGKPADQLSNDSVHYAKGYKAAVNQVSAALSADNTNFDRDRFLKAAGIV